MLRSEMQARGCGWLLASAGAMLAAGIAGPSSAHTEDGILGAGASATAYYQVTCSNNGSGAPASLITQVLDTDTGSAAGALVSVQSRKANSATNSTDLVGGDAEPSPLVWVNGAAGVYDVFVDKTEGGAKPYTLTFHCMTGVDGTGVHTGTAITTRQSGGGSGVGSVPLPALLYAAGGLLAAGLATLRARS